MDWTYKYDEANVSELQLFHSIANALKYFDQNIVFLKHGDTTERHIDEISPANILDYTIGFSPKNTVFTETDFFFGEFFFDYPGKIVLSSAYLLEESPENAGLTPIAGISFLTKIVSNIRNAIPECTIACDHEGRDIPNLLTDDVSSVVQHFDQQGSVRSIATPNTLKLDDLTKVFQSLEMFPIDYRKHDFGFVDIQFFARFECIPRFTLTERGISKDYGNEHYLGGIEAVYFSWSFQKSRRDKTIVEGIQKVPLYPPVVFIIVELSLLDNSVGQFHLHFPGGTERLKAERKMPFEVSTSIDDFVNEIKLRCRQFG